MRRSTKPEQFRSTRPTHSDTATSRSGGRLWLLHSRPNHRPAFRRSRWAACFARFPQIAMLHHLLARPRVRSTNRSVQVEPWHAFAYSKSSPHTNLPTSSARAGAGIPGSASVAAPSVPGRAPLRKALSRPGRIVRPGRAGGSAAPSRAGRRRRVSSRFAPAGSPGTIRRRPLAWAATASNSPGIARSRTDFSSSAVTSPASSSQASSPSPESIQSTGVSTGVAKVFRKSSPREPEMKNAGGFYAHLVFPAHVVTRLSLLDRLSGPP